MDARALADAIVAGLVRHGVDRIFGMPGGGNNLDLIGAAQEAGIPFVLGHHENATAIMAGVYGDLMNAPGVCLVTRGPGAANVVNGVANAQLDRQPLVIVTDVVSAEDAPRISHQRLNQRQLFESVTKLSVTVGGQGETAHTCEQAIAAALANPPGAVHLDFDPSAQSSPVAPKTDARSSDRQIEQALKQIAAAKRPVVLLGVGARKLEKPIRDWLANSNIPVLMTYRAKGVLPDSAANNAGLVTGATMEAPILQAADLIVLIGLDSVELIPNPWPYSAPVISLAAWPETSPYLVPEVEVVGDLAGMVSELTQLDSESTWPLGAGNAQRDREIARFRAAGTTVGQFSPQQVVDLVRGYAPPGTVATVDAGAHMFPATVLWSVENSDELLISSGLATMGFALPAAIGAALARPDRKIVCFTGDGGLGMCIGELETVKRLGLNIAVIVLNDSLLSLIALKADPAIHGGASATNYELTDFAQVAQGYGIAGHVVKSSAELEALLKQVMGQVGPALLDVRIDASGYPEIVKSVRGKRE